MKVVFAMCLILLGSCTKYAPVSRDSVGTIIQDIEMEVYQLNEIEWFVGKRKEEKITQSLTFIVSMPKVKEDDLDYLREKKNIDAWIVRLISRKSGEERDLGSLYTLFKPQRAGRGHSGGPAASVTIKLYYAAAYASERFRNFKCPAFSHNKKVDRMSIEGENTPFELMVTAGAPYGERSQLIDLTPSSFNAGHSLIGDYYLEIAAYNSQKRIVYSPFKRIPMSVAVRSEEAINIQSCAGERPEISL